MSESKIYTPKQFHLSGLNGISDQTLEMHFKLYEGYVKETNNLNDKLAALRVKGAVDAEQMATFSELKRRLGFEYNGMVLHEYYFDNLKAGNTGEAEKSSAFAQASEQSFGSYENWKADFISVGKMRGIGWAICYQDPSTKRLSNHWITLHEDGNIAGFAPVLVMDVWEHAYLLDYKPADKDKYIEAFFSNIDWSRVDARLKNIAAASPASR
jgi:Fe-Mn family superoxide dismutase